MDTVRGVCAHLNAFGQRRAGLEGFPLKIVDATARYRNGS
jgi:hypothetical protein